jgi:hypothetical protein
VWEIEGAEFSASSHHTANGISIRFPRVKGIREDKDWESHTTIALLTQLSTASTEHLELTVEGFVISFEQNLTNVHRAKGKKVLPTLKKTRSSSDTEALVQTAKKKQKMETKIQAKDRPSYSPNLFKVEGSITEPQGGSENKIVVNFSDNSGKWSKRGMFREISSKWKEPEESFRGLDCDMGDVHLCQVQQSIFSPCF